MAASRGSRAGGRAGGRGGAAARRPVLQLGEDGGGCWSLLPRRSACGVRRRGRRPLKAEERRSISNRGRRKPEVFFFFTFSWLGGTAVAMLREEVSVELMGCG